MYPFVYDISIYEWYIIYIIYYLSVLSEHMWAHFPENDWWSFSVVLFPPQLHETQAADASRGSSPSEKVRPHPSVPLSHDTSERDQTSLWCFSVSLQYIPHILCWPEARGDGAGELQSSVRPGEHMFSWSLQNPAGRQEDRVFPQEVNLWVLPNMCALGSRHTTRQMTSVFTPGIKGIYLHYHFTAKLKTKLRTRGDFQNQES